ncbi:MAG: alpha-D-ribose 1-methylphosphonate 5-triphosphate diphosphatase [Desulfonatronovibrio sp.]
MKQDKNFQIVNARAVTREDILDRAIISIQDGKIADLSRDSRNLNKDLPVLDAGGAWVIPGFMDLHSDAIEKEIETRPGSCLPVEMAVAELDKKLAAAGVTTIFHSISFAEKEYAILRTMDMAESIIRQIRAMQGQLSVKTRIHLRYEITNTESLPVITELIRNRQVDLVSIMDHTPGQGQFSTSEEFKKYYSAYFSRDEQEVQEIMEQRKAIRDSVGLKNACYVAEVCTENKVPLASHDDDSREKIDFIASLGAVISEFPINMEAMSLAREQGLMVAVGSPNIIRGGSHNNNLRAMDIIRAKGADIVCSDYVPSTLLHALFKIHSQCPMPLPEAVRLFSTNPAKAVNADASTGRLEPGLDADLLLVDSSLSYPRIIKTFVQGREAFSSCIPRD